MLSRQNLTVAQIDAVDRLFEEDETLLIAGLGFGKAIVGLTAIQDLIQEGYLHRVLVLAPLRVAQLTWGAEPDKWSHINVDVAIACGTPKQRKAAVESGAPVVVTNFENVQWVLSNYGNDFQGLCIDEITKLKTVSGTAAKTLRFWVKKLAWRVGMTGTPVAECGTDIYGQALLLDKGKALGTRFDTFKRKYFYPTDYNEYNWAMHEGAQEKLAAVLQGLVYRADDQDYLDALPPVHTDLVTLALPEEAQAVYDAMAKDSVVTMSTDIVAENAAVQQGKKFQIAAGGLYDNDGDLMWTSGHKERACIDIVSRIGAPVIVVYQFSFELDWLTTVYPDAPVLGAGGKFTLAQQAAWNAGEHDVLIMHPKSAAHGLNLQESCNHMLFLSPVWGADPWAQTLGRIRRRGTPFDIINRIVLVSAGTVDEVVLGRQDEKFESADALMKALI